MTSLLLLALLLTVGIGVIIVYFNKKLASLQKPDDNRTLLEWLKTTQQSIESTNRMIHQSLHANSSQMVKTLQENSKELNERLDRAAVVIKEVSREVGQMNEIGRSMRELQDFLKSPKLRGNIGEQVLTDLISQVFPKNSFHLQYTFKSGEKVDAAIKTDAGILPIDSKFPLENFQKLTKSRSETETAVFRKEFFRDVKKHIDAIAKKYIIPDEGTMDFALMYVPSEAVFYEIVNADDIIEYARHVRVYIVSPTTLYAHLQTILLSFEGKKIESQSREVLRLLHSLQVDYNKVNESLDILGKHITNASNQYSNVSKGFLSFGQKLESTKQLENVQEKLLD